MNFCFAKSWSRIEDGTSFFDVAKIVAVRIWLSFLNLILLAVKTILFFRKSKNPQKIIIYKSGNIGDIICAMPAMRARSAFGFYIRTSDMFKKTQVDFTLRDTESVALLRVLDNNGIHSKEVKFEFPNINFAGRPIKESIAAWFPYGSNMYAAQSALGILILLF